MSIKKLKLYHLYLIWVIWFGLNGHDPIQFDLYLNYNFATCTVLLTQQTEKGEINNITGYTALCQDQ